MPDTGGAGRFRGGNGFVRRFRIEAESAQICLCADRHRTGPPGLAGGLAGQPASYILNPDSEGELPLPSKTPYIDMSKGTVVSLQSAGGGGYGHAGDRDRARIAEDVANGYTSESAARKFYDYDPEPN